MASRAPLDPACIDDLLTRLHAGDVRFVIVGGLARALRGATAPVVDVDLCYARDPDNRRRLVAALRPVRPRLCAAPTASFAWDLLALRSDRTLGLVTDAGPLDLLVWVPGLGCFDRVDGAATDLPVRGRTLRVLDRDGLERSALARARAQGLAGRERRAMLGHPVAASIDPRDSRNARVVVDPVDKDPRRAELQRGT